jgi:DNA-binding LacI/PurR family transcriptional regulator
MGIPIVAFDRAVDDHRADAVIADNAGGARRATEHLLDAGHTRIGFVGGRDEIQTGPGTTVGLRGSHAAAARRGGRASRTASSGSTAARRRPIACSPPIRDISALVVANNLMAVGALRALRARARRVPEDIALVAIDDPYWAGLVDPPLTTLAQPVDGMARAAVDLLFERVEGDRTTPALGRLLVRPASPDVVRHVAAAADRGPVHG